MHLLEQYLSFPVPSRGRRAVNLQLSWNRNPSLSVNNEITPACAREFGVGVWEGQHTAVGDFWHGWGSGAVKHRQVPRVGFPRGFQGLHALENISHPSAHPHLLVFGAGHCTLLICWGKQLKPHPGLEEMRICFGGWCPPPSWIRGTAELD